MGAGAAVSEAVPPWPPELPAPLWPPELPAPHMASRAPSSTWTSVCLFHSGGPRPVYVSVSVLWGLQSAHPPLPGSYCYGTGRAFREGGVMLEICRVRLVVPASCFLYLVVFPVCSHYRLLLSPVVLITMCI